MPSEKRRSTRQNAAEKIKITYVDDQGHHRFEIVQAQDLSPTGCRLLLRFPCHPRAIVAISLSPLHTGSASVRFQKSSPRGYVTGLEFLGGLRLPI